MIPDKLRRILNAEIYSELLRFCSEVRFTSCKSACVNNNAVFSVTEEIDIKK